MVSNVRATMIRGTAARLSRHGLDGTSFATVLADTGAPRGSVYHHFPAGKHELVSGAVRYAGDVLVDVLDRANGATPADIMVTFTSAWRTVLTGSDLDAGCAVAAVAVGAPDDPDLQAVTGEVFARWAELLAERLESAGLAPGAGRPLAIIAIAAVEGALLMTRAVRDMTYFDTVAAQLHALTVAAQPRPATGQRG